MFFFHCCEGNIKSVLKIINYKLRKLKVRALGFELKLLEYVELKASSRTQSYHGYNPLMRDIFY